MKKLLFGILVAVAICGISSCRSDYDPLNDGNYRIHREKVEPVMKTVSLNFGGDFITESEEPLLRAEDGDSYIAIDVARKQKDVADAESEPYAYGLFKNQEYNSIKIDVETGYTYTFKATILIEREDVVFVNQNKYYEPFRVQDGTSANFDNAGPYESKYLNSFQYTTNIDVRNRLFFCQLNYGTAYVDTKGDFSPRYARLSYPRVKRYYGLCSSYDPGLQNEVNIDMGYKSFGLRLEVESLPAGELSVKDISNKSEEIPENVHGLLVFSKGFPLKNEEGVNSWEGLFSMFDLEASSETFTLEFTWHKGGNNTESFTSDVTIRPNTKKILKLNITGTPNYGTKGNIVLSVEDEKLTEDTEQINHDFDQEES